MPSPRKPSLDEIDHIIVSILAKNPRTPYSEIADVLGDRGHELSAEAIRKRVAKIFDATSMFFLLSPEEHDWEIVRIGINVEKKKGAKERVFEVLGQMNLWFIVRGFGSMDFYVVATATSNEAVDDLLTEIGEIEHVVDTEYIVETARITNIQKYLIGEDSIG